MKLDDSPYKPPSPVAAAPTRWRIIPAFLLTIFGGMLVIGWLLNIVAFVAGLTREPIRASSPAAHVAGLILMTIAGGVAIAAGRCWWRQQWRWAVFGTLVAYGVGVLGGILLYPDSF